MARRMWIVCLSLALAGTAFPAVAQDTLLEDLYGRGVHAYFEHRYEEAHGLLTKAITSGLKDPRAYYFRGLSYLRLGRPDEAKAEFTTGAELEAIAAEPVNVGKSLERIQGADRLAIERHRSAARLLLHNRAEAAAKARYEERLEAEERVILPPARRAAPAAPPGSTPPEAAPPRAAPARSTPPAAEETDPFRDESAPPAAPAETKPSEPVPAEPEPPAAAEPAEPKPAVPAPGEPKPAEPPPSSDPFAEPSAEEPKPAEQPPAAAAEGPRGSVLGALFRAAKNSIPATVEGADEPASPAAEAAEANPFGPAPAQPPPASNDPFAE